MKALVNKKRWSPTLAASVLMFASFICILLPVTGTILMLGNKIGKAVENSQEVVHAMRDQIGKIEDKFGYEF